MKIKEFLRLKLPLYHFNIKNLVIEFHFFIPSIKKYGSKILIQFCGFLKILMFYSPELLATDDGRGSWLAPEPTVSPVKLNYARFTNLIKSTSFGIKFFKINVFLYN